jgi:hypothetical protein
MHRFSLNILLLLSFWLVFVSLQDQYHKSNGAKQGKQRHKEAIFKVCHSSFLLRTKYLYIIEKAQNKYSMP